jgi:predicted PurR-regulated permease PerM
MATFRGNKAGQTEAGPDTKDSSPDEDGKAQYQRADEARRETIALEGDQADARGDQAAEDSATPDEIDILPALGDLDPEDANWAHVTPVIGAVDHTPDSQKVTTRIEIPVRTIIAVVGTLFGIWVMLQVWEIFLLVFLAFLLAVAMHPLVTRMEQNGAPRALGAGIVFLGLIAMIAGFFIIILPPLVSQGTSVVNNAPEYLNQFERIIRRYPSLYARYREFQATSADAEGFTPPWGQILSVSSGIVTRVVNFFFVMVLTFYLLLEGERSYKFLARYCTPRLRYRLRRAFPEITRVVSGYVVGQLINSVAFGLFAFITLLILDVPEPLLLAVLAGVLDAVPIAGVPIATIPAIVLAATVSWQTALIVLVAYIAYQQFENYVMIPRVFGNTLSVSSLSILVGVLVGGQLLGVLGIILSLPITAAIPVIERVWVEEVPEDLSHEQL